MKVDFHTHSVASTDGSITAEQYRQALASGLLDCIAITDHDITELAASLHSELGDKIIVGEEIMTADGEIIGLYLSKTIPPGLSAQATVAAIKEQDGLVYIPHPFETTRHSVQAEVLDALAGEELIIEVHNGRAVWSSLGPKVATWATLHQKARASSSDAHAQKGLGHSYTVLKNLPTRQNVLRELQSAKLETGRPPLTSLLAPKLNRLKRRFGKQ